MFQENFSSDFDNKPQLSLSQPSKKKIKPHLPAESVGKRYVERFWHPFGAIIAPNQAEGDEKPAWRTIDYYLQPSQLWNLHQDKSKLVGLRFNDTTRYATIDLDLEGDYHNIESINRIKAALEDIGIVDIIILQSSFSGGYHLILTFASPLPTFALACALEITLRNAGFILRQGHLEIFPNTKPYSAKQITNYKAIRCPMQPGSGSFLLNDDLQPISDSVSIFLDYCDRARAEYKRRFHKTISQETLQKHLHLWHPTRYILDPWTENSSNPYKSTNYGQFNSFQNSFAKQSAENPYQKENDGHSFYMKVFCKCLPPAADAPTGQQAVASFEEVAVSEGELFVPQVQDESEEININSEELNLLQSEDLSLTSSVNNSDNSLVYLNVIRLAENLNESTSDKNFKYFSNPSAAQNYNNKNLLINSVSIPPTAPTSAIVPPEMSQKAEVSEQNTPSSDPAATLALSELKKLTKLRLQAASHAKRVAREYCLIARRLIGGRERERLEQSAKMQFYLDSGNKTLIAEANEWAAVNPGCLPFSLELAFQESER